MFEYMYNGTMYSIDELREVYFGEVRKNPGIYDAVSFDSWFNRNVNDDKIVTYREYMVTVPYNAEVLISVVQYAPTSESAIELALDRLYDIGLKEALNVRKKDCSVDYD